MAPCWSGPTTSCQSSQSIPMWKKGPTVCDGVTAARPADAVSVIVVLPVGRGGVGATQNDVEAEPQGPVLLGHVVVVGRYQPLTSPLGYGIEDRVQRLERVTGEVHLGHEPVGQPVTECLLYTSDAAD